MSNIVQYFLLVLISVIAHFAAFIPFINVLFELKFRRAQQVTKDIFDNKTPIFDSFHAHKAGTPVGGGILVVAITSFLFVITLYVMYIFGYSLKSIYTSSFIESGLLLFTFMGFGTLGLYDDAKGIFVSKTNTFFGLRAGHKLILQIILAATVSTSMYLVLKIDFINLPFFGAVHIGWFFVVYATFVIIAFTNAVNITDGLDGLAAGCIMISLMFFWLIARTNIDVPISIFIALWLGGIIAFLYFNIYPARIFMGDAGSLAFGAAFAVVALLLGKSIAAVVIGGVFVLEVLSSALQLDYIYSFWFLRTASCVFISTSYHRLI
jgi:phospho-N-acetylmuramoyl-pentapeptide-transferase